MTFRFWCQSLGVKAVLLVPGVGALAAPPADTGGLREPVYRVAKADANARPAANPQPTGGPVEVTPAQEHPLMPALRRAQEGLTHIDKNIQDYSCTVVKRENVGGTIGDHEYMFTKIRHNPFSVYLYFLGPPNIKGREVIYVDGANENKLIAHEGGGRIKAALPTVQLDPTGLIAMRNQRYPITELGIRNLTARLIEVADQDTKYGECEVKFYKGAKVAGRVCTYIQVVHPVPRKNFRYHIAKIFVDDELNIPIRFESYDWPAQPGGEPILLEEYTYTNIKINNGFTDADFNRENSNYRF